MTAETLLLSVRGYAAENLPEDVRRAKVLFFRADGTVSDVLDEELAAALTPSAPSDPSAAAPSSRSTTS